METASILAQIWGQLLEVRPAEKASPLTEVLGALLKVPVVGIVSQSEVFEPTAMKESEELLPGATLGDVLHEELGLFIEQGAVVVLEPEKSANAVGVHGQDLGRALGRILVDLAERELTVLQGEGKAVKTPSTSEVSRQRLGTRRSVKLSDDRFGAGLGSLSQAWAASTLN